MALPVIAGCVRITFNWVLTGTLLRAHNVIHANYAGGDTDEDIAGKLNSAVSSLGTPNSLFSTSATAAHLDDFELLKLDGTSGSTIWNFDDPQAGTTGGDAIPQGCTTVALQTGKRGGSKRGRVFCPYVAEDAVDNGILKAAKVDGMGTVWADFVIAMADNVLAMVVASYKLRSFEQVNSIRVDRVMTTQRRRAPKL